MPAELGDAAFLIRTGWTYQAYLDTPEQLVQKMFLLFQAEAAAQRMAEAKARGRT